METERKREVVNICLDLFIEKGLNKTSTRDLSKALMLQSGGLYYYFRTKDDVVLACVETAIGRLESKLIECAKCNVCQPAVMINELLQCAVEMAPVYRFVGTVCSDIQYSERTKRILDEIGNRYVRYTEDFATILNCRISELTPFVYMGITAITNYMIFEELSFVAPQLKAIQLKLERILANGKEDR